MKNTRVARRYAAALMAAAEQHRTVEAVTKDLDLIGRMLRDSRDFYLFIANPIIRGAKKRAVFTELLEPRVGRETMTFVNLLTSKGRENILPEVIEQFKSLHDEKAGIVNVSVVSAVELTYAQEKELKAVLERWTDKKVRLHASIDRTIKGGMVAKVGDTVLDASITRQLERMRERFVAGHMS